MFVISRRVRRKNMKKKRENKRKEGGIPIEDVEEVDRGHAFLIDSRGRRRGRFAHFKTNLLEKAKKIKLQQRINAILFLEVEGLLSLSSRTPSNGLDPK
jgi:hypothetical protein